MPLVHYRTGDTVAPGEEACACGRVFPTIKTVLGRQEKVITLPDGRMIGRLDRIFQGHDRHLVEGQVAYRGNGRFLLRVVATEGWSAADSQAMVDKFLLRVPGVEVTVQKVAAIPRGRNGKFEFVVIEEQGEPCAPREIHDV
jgi:phenylacetate-CoA ligase